MVDLDFLATIPIFGFFTSSELEAAAKQFKEVSFAKDDVVIRIGEPGDTFYVVLDGELAVWDASQPPRQTGTIRRGDYFGDDSFLPHLAAARAMGIEPTIVKLPGIGLDIDQPEDVQALLRAAPRMATHAIRLLQAVSASPPARV